LKKNHIYKGDCVKILDSKIIDNSIDMIYADPPYNLSGKSLSLKGNKTGGDFNKINEDWDTFTYDGYLKFSKNWLHIAFKKMKTGGSIYISCTFHNIGEVIYLAKKENLELRNIITWYKINAMPNITKRTFTHSSEYVLWFTKGKKWKFNYEEVKKINPHRTKDGKVKQMRDFLDFIEIPIVQGQERLRGEKSNVALHPTQKPEKLIELLLTASSDEGDLVLDPFFGTGTTGVVAKRMKRDYIGIELNDTYFTAAKNRLSKIK